MRMISLIYYIIWYIQSFVIQHFFQLNPLTNRVSRISQASALHIRWGVELGKVLAKEAAIWWVPWRGVDMVGRNGMYPLVMTNIAMENGPFIDDFPS